MQSIFPKLLSESSSYKALSEILLINFKNEFHVIGILKDYFQHDKKPSLYVYIKKQSIRNLSLKDKKGALFQLYQNSLHLKRNFGIEISTYINSSIMYFCAISTIFYCLLNMESFQSIKDQVTTFILYAKVLRILNKLEYCKQKAFE